MREQPRITRSQLAEVLAGQYSLSPTEISFLALGNDSASFVYRVRDTSGEVHFLKMRARGGFSLASLAVPRHLADLGVPHITAPLTTNTGSLWVDLGDYALTLYPYIEGQMAAKVGMSADQWREFGALARRIHATPMPTGIVSAMPSETFIPSRRGVMDGLEQVIARRAFTNSIERGFATFWSRQSDVIRRLVRRADSLGNELRSKVSELVPCHADMHLWNVLVDTDSEFWLVDWDETILAPKERDLMFVVGGIGRGLVKPEETQAFLAGYGAPNIDVQALTYFRYAWAVQDIAAYGEAVFFLPGLCEDTRADAFEGFKDVLCPRGIASIAMETDEML
jgi:spectinomycin phosphotransferase